jgi:hypothetical protein
MNSKYWFPAFLFILLVLMARCAFCEKSFGPKGFARHITTCPKKAEFIQASAAQALATHNTEIAAAAELAQTQALLGSQNLDEVILFPWIYRIIITTNRKGTP